MLIGYVKHCRIVIMFRTFWFGIKNLIKWFPLIWNDRQWDDGYLFEILQFKLSEMSKYFDSDNAVCADAKLRARQIYICKLLIDRILLNDYTTPFDVRDEPRHQRFAEAFEKSMASGSDSFIYDREDTPLESKVFKWKTEHEDYLEQQDIEMLFRLMSKQIKSWWD